MIPQVAQSMKYGVSQNNDEVDRSIMSNPSSNRMMDGAMYRRSMDPNLMSKKQSSFRASSQNLNHIYDRLS